MAIMNVTDAAFAEEVEASTGTVLLDFWAPWCGPCKMMSPVLEELSNELGDSVKVVKVNVDDNPASASKYNIMSIPTLLVFKEGQVIQQMTGLQTKDQLKAALA
ncbi:thioredoxin 1 [Paenibacillus shirakamiensis]|uniref:Thioredoxin n=1 Tax=Paenibacillus shirakamiensis TaxID=1265935 RepID=A0ABS4JK81_9BACL|nr:thioredoxin [Paenibacillus shirakamiensis]MBP2001511.1 thioredoxin 1 [Paenibacillus shirakamiensis]